MQKLKRCSWSDCSASSSFLFLAPSKTEGLLLVWMTLYFFKFCFQNCRIILEPINVNLVKNENLKKSHYLQFITGMESADLYIELLFIAVAQFFPLSRTGMLSIIRSFLSPPLSPTREGRLLLSPLLSFLKCRKVPGKTFFVWNKQYCSKYSKILMNTLLDSYGSPTGTEVGTHDSSTNNRFSVFCIVISLPCIVSRQQSLTLLFEA